MSLNSDFGSYLKNLLLEKKMSMTKLSKETGIDKATISRISNNKQVPTNNHLKKLSIALNVPLEELFSIVNGVNINTSNTNEFNSFTNFSDSETILSFSNLLDNTYLSKQVEKELTKYQQLMDTNEGELLITKDFDSKINSLSQTGPFVNTLKDLYDRFRSKDIPKKDFILIGSVLLYFILPIDIIPDFIFPIGFIDDMIAVSLVLPMLKSISNT